MKNKDQSYIEYIAVIITALLIIVSITLIITNYFKKEKIMFVGDFIFADSIGRTDLETGNMKDMQKSLSNIKKIDNRD